MDDLLVLLLIGICSPFVMLGTVFLTGKLHEIVKVKRGCVKAYFITRNHSLKRFFSKPKGSQLKIGQMSFDYKDTPGYVVRDGASPTVFYNEKTAEQIDMTNQEQKSKVDPNHFSDLLVRAFNLGVISTVRDEKKLLLFVMIGCFAAVGSCIVGLLGMNTISSFADYTAPLLEKIWSAVSVV